jgi:hypothetical protein
MWDFILLGIIILCFVMGLESSGRNSRRVSKMTSKTVYVVMGNDFPEAVYEEEGDAIAFVDAKKEEETKKQSSDLYRIYWRYYDFELKGRGK